MLRHAGGGGRTYRDGQDGEFTIMFEDGFVKQSLQQVIETLEHTQCTEATQMTQARRELKQEPAGDVTAVYKSLPHGATVSIWCPLHVSSLY